MENLILSLTLQEVQIIRESLGKMPHDVVNSLIVKIETDINNQLKNKNENTNRVSEK